MSATRAMLRKEFLEQWRTNKIIIMAAAFFILGMSGPISLKFLPELIKNSGNASGLSITLTKQMTANDYILNFFNQLTSIPVLVLVLVAMGAIAGERERGTQVLVLTKPVSRTQFVATKFLVYFTVLTGIVLVTALAAIYYTLILSEVGTINFGAFALITLTLLSFLGFILAVSIFFSAVMRSSVAAGGLAFITYVIISIGNGFLPATLKDNLPFGVLDLAQKALLENAPLSNLVIPMLSGFALTIVIVGIACLVAEKSEI